jgi:hypothetical protein
MKLKPDISTLLKTGHFYFALTSIKIDLTSIFTSDINQITSTGDSMYSLGLIALSMGIGIDILICTYDNVYREVYIDAHKHCN